MNVVNNKNFSPLSPCVTCQELELKQLFLSEKIPFEFQKVFSLPYCQYIVDFFLLQRVILECTSTNMLKYQVSLRKKAIHLEAKCSQLKNQYNDVSIWVLFQAYRPILEPFSHTLIRLMPSVDNVFFSQQELREYLQMHFFSINKLQEVVF